jgi:hypothetical protein
MQTTFEDRSTPDLARDGHVRYVYVSQLEETTNVDRACSIFNDALFSTCREAHIRAAETPSPASAYDKWTLKSKSSGCIGGGCLARC